MPSVQAAEFRPHRLSPSNVVEIVRRIKSPAEIERLRESQRINESIFDAILAQSAGYRIV